MSGRDFAPRYAREPLPEACIFCGQKKKKLTHEDYWLIWLQNFMPVTHPNTIHKLLRVTFPGGSVSNQAVVQEMPGRFSRPGNVLAKRLKIVCQSCNNGWMSRLQTRAKPLLKPLLLGQWAELDEGDQAEIAAWACMFTMVYEFSDLGTIATPQDQRQLFMAKRLPTPPDNWIIACGLMDGTQKRGTAWHQGVYVIGGTQASDASPCNLQTTTIAAGRLCLYTYSTTINSLFTPLDIQTSFNLQVIWPPTGKSTKPAATIDSHRFDAIAMGIIGLLHSSNLSVDQASG
jgi:hypothetical protein